MIIDILEPISTAKLNCTYSPDLDIFIHHNFASFVRAGSEAQKRFYVIGALVYEGIVFAAFDRYGNEVAAHTIYYKVAKETA